MTAHVRRRWLNPLIWSLGLLSVLLLVATWRRSTGALDFYVGAGVPQGQLLYVFCKLLGLLAVVAMWVQISLGLLQVTPRTREFVSLSRRSHVWLGVGTVALAIAHVGCFLAASSLRTGHSPFDLLLPRFDQGFYRTRISMGAVALWLLLLALGAGVLRAAAPRRRWLHRSSMVGFGLAVLHAMAVGSETRMTHVEYLFIAFATTVAVLVLSALWPERLSHRVRS